ncbi:MAG: methionine-R-sulfoxide reductase [Acidobacteria bacterium]|nr:methionine-R-sulfoxide reductase [Acidobacteriota bacterium]
MPYNHLSTEEERVIVHKGTERPFTGEYDKLFSPGTFICRRCNNALYSAEAKFNAGCGWPSFDEEYPDSVERHVDADGRRIEITCARCQAHLGHVFEGEGFTDKDTRHCVNSLSIRFIPEDKALPPVLDAN